jgi:hypothetical protein
MTATANGTEYAATSTLRRNGAQAIPAHGAVDQTQEGVFTITFSGADRLGNSATLTKCWTHQPIGAPIQVTTSGDIPPAEVVTFDALKNYKLENNDPISALLNGTARGAGLM